MCSREVSCEVEKLEESAMVQGWVEVALVCRHFMLKVIYE